MRDRSINLWRNGSWYLVQWAILGLAAKLFFYCTQLLKTPSPNIFFFLKRTTNTKEEYYYVWFWAKNDWKLSYYLKWNLIPSLCCFSSPNIIRFSIQHLRIHTILCNKDQLSQEKDSETLYLCTYIQASSEINSRCPVARYMSKTLFSIIRFIKHQNETTSETVTTCTTSLPVLFLLTCL